MDSAAIVAAAVFALSVAVGVGRLSSRIDALEEWRSDMKDDIKRIREVIDGIDRAIALERGNARPH